MGDSFCFSSFTGTADGLSWCYSCSPLSWKHCNPLARTAGVVPLASSHTTPYISLDVGISDVLSIRYNYDTTNSWWLCVDTSATPDFLCYNPRYIQVLRPLFMNYKLSGVDKKNIVIVSTHFSVFCVPVLFRRIISRLS